MNLITLHLEKAERNEELHRILLTNEPDRFFDCKIVALFYAAVHYLKALSLKQHINIGETHYEIEGNCNPDRQMPIMPLDRDAWLHFSNLSRYSKESRYNVVVEQLKKDYAYCLDELNKFKKYIKSQGVAVKI